MYGGVGRTGNPGMFSAPASVNLCRAVALSLLAFAALLSQADAQTAVSAQTATEDPLPQRVVTFGTSLTALGGWQPMLQEELRRCFGPNLVVLNEGEAGKGSAWGVDNVRRAIDARPDIAIVEFAINDAEQQPTIGSDLARSRAQMEAIITAIRAANPLVRIYLMITNPARGPFGASRPNLIEYYEMYHALARDGLGTLIDTSAAWAATTDLDIPDGLHPTTAAHLAITVPAIVAAVAPDCRPRP